MPVDVKGKITYNPDAKGDSYMMECAQLGISEPASGSLEDDIEELRGRITKAMSEEFSEPEAVQMTGYSMNMNFSIEGPVNHTLDKFTKEKEEVTAEDGS